MPHCMEADTPAKRTLARTRRVIDAGEQKGKDWSDMIHFVGK